MLNASRHETGLQGVEVIEITSDRTFPRHSHDEFGFGVMQHGGQTSWSGRGLVEAEAGNLMTVNPAEMHVGIGRRVGARHWRMLFLTPEAVTRHGDLDAQVAEFHNPVDMDPATAGLATGLLADITNPAVDRAGLEEQLILILHRLLAPRSACAAATGAGLSQSVARVMARIGDEWDQPLTLADFAATAGCSRYQILRRFKRETGISPHGYLTQHRIKAARRMIRQGMPLAEAALASGFSDQSHLTRQFRRQYGLTPGRFVGAPR